MSLLSVVKDVCLNVGVTAPVSVFAGINDSRTMQEMLSLANEMSQRICYDTREWTKLKATNVFVGDGVLDTSGVLTGTVGFTFPVNFKRMLLTANVWRSTSSQTPMRFIPDTDEWLQRRLQKYNDARGEWTIIGGQMHIYPMLMAATGTAPAETATFVYLDKNCIALSNGGYGDVFLTDNDNFVLDERLLKLGMIWQWKASKGSPYTEDMGTYGDALVLAMGNDSPAPIMHGRGQIFAGTEAVPPWVS